ncbi:MAG: hydroxymethylbilane synthase [Chitinophagaceae bacterium]
MAQTIRIGTRESQLAVWQATSVQNLLKENRISSELIFIKSEGDLDTVTPLYELGVQGIFTKTLDAALLNNRIDIAVHSMKDVPTKLAEGIQQAAVLKRASYKDILVYKGEWSVVNSEMGLVNRETLPSFTIHHSPFTIATSSIRRKAQWLHRYPHHTIENLRGNVNTRLNKLKESNWDGAIFAAAGLERIGLRPENAIDLDWMLPAPSQGAIVVVCRKEDNFSYDSCQSFNDEATALCTKLEKDFLRVLMGGCSTPISALAEIIDDNIVFRGNICSVDGKKKIEVKKQVAIKESETAGIIAAQELLTNPEAQQILTDIRNAKA